MLFVARDLGVEGVVDGDVCAGHLIDPMHVVLELGAMSVSVDDSGREEQVAVDHLVQQRLDQVSSRAKFQQWLTQANGGESGNAVEGADAGAA